MNKTIKLMHRDNEQQTHKEKSISPFQQTSSVLLTLGPDELAAVVVVVTEDRILVRLAGRNLKKRLTDELPLEDFAVAVAVGYRVHEKHEDFVMTAEYGTALSFEVGKQDF